MVRVAATVSEDAMPVSPMLDGSAVRRAYISTTLVVILAMLESLVGYKIIASRLGAEAFGQYSLLLRLQTLLQPPLLVGTGVALPRFLARLNQHNDRNEVAAWLRSALGIVFAALVLGIGILLIGAPWIAKGLLGDTGRASAIRSFTWLIAGACAHGVAFGYLRGVFEIRRANLLLFVNYVAAPLVAALTAPTLTAALTINGAIVAGFSLASIAHGVHRASASKSRQLLRFGLPRIPGEFMVFGLLTIPPVLAVHERDISDAGIFAFSVALISAAAALVGPMSAILLPYASNLIGTGSAGQLRRHTQRIVIGVASITAFGVALGEFLAEPILRLYLGRVEPANVLTLRLVLTAAVPYVIYVAGRSLIDAYHVRAVNMRNASVSFIFGMLLAAAGNALNLTRTSETALLVGVSLLAVLTIRDVRRVFRELPSGPDLRRDAAVGPDR